LYLGIDPRELDHDMPGNRVLAVVIHPTTGPLPITSDCVDDVGYQLAVGAATEALRSGTPAPVEASQPPVTVPLPDWSGQPMLWRPGQAPRKRRWFVRPWGIAAVLFLIGGLLDVAGGIAPLELARYDVIDTGGNVRDLARDPSTDRVYALAYDGAVLRVDTGVAEEVTRIDGDIRRLHVAQGWLIATDLGGVVRAFDTDSGRTWQQALGEQPAAVTDPHRPWRGDHRTMRIVVGPG